MEMCDFELIVGPMKSGKSKYLIDCFAGNKTVEAYKPSIDTRNQDFIVSRAYVDKQIPCKQVSSLYNINPTQPIVLVDEFQFFNIEELKDFVLKCKQRHHKLIMAGLDLLADGSEWSAYTELKPMANKITKLRAKCSVCGEPAEFSALISGDKNKKIQIEGEATYEPRCKNHFDKSK